MKSVGLLVLLSLAPSLMAQSPVKATLAFSRASTTAVSAPSSSDSAQAAETKTDYLIYVVVSKGTIASATGACIEGKLFASTLQKVDSPVMVELDKGVKDTLVGATDDDVYQVELGAPRHSNPKCLPPQEGGPPRGSAAAVLMRLGSGQAAWNAVTDRIVPLRPSAGS
jgi:hypothetical protein